MRAHCSRHRDDHGDPDELTLAPSPPTYPPTRTQLPVLLNAYGAFCQGCGGDFRHDVRLLNVDHMFPKSRGGTDACENLTLLCGPCNAQKGSSMTLAALRVWNRRKGFLVPENEMNLHAGERSAEWPADTRHETNGQMPLMQ